jgi:hypothetical protein
LDGDFVRWLKAEYQREGDEENVVDIGQKTFSFKHCELFQDSNTLPKILQFDREIHRFNTNRVSNNSTNQHMLKEIYRFETIEVFLVLNQPTLFMTVHLFVDTVFV